MINRIQNLRKESGFEVTDKIRVKIASQPDVDEAVKQNILYICTETLAESFEIVDDLPDEGKAEVELTDSISIFLTITRVL